MAQAVQPSSGGSVNATSGRPTGGHRSERELPMSVASTSVPISRSLQDTNKRRTETPQRDRSPASPPPTWREVIERFAPLVLAPAFFGPPALFLIGPWLLLVLMLIPPAALLITFGLVFLLAAAALGALVALLVSPYFVVRHLRTRHAARPHRFPFLRRPTGVTQIFADHRSQPARSGWAPAPVAGGSSPQASWPS